MTPVRVLLCLSCQADEQISCNHMISAHQLLCALLLLHFNILTMKWTKMMKTFYNG